MCSRGANFLQILVRLSTSVRKRRKGEKGKRREEQKKKRGKEEKRNIGKGRLLPTCMVGLELPKPYPIGTPGTNMTSVILTIRLGTFSEVKILSSTMYVSIL